MAGKGRVSKNGEEYEMRKRREGRKCKVEGKESKKVNNKMVQREGKVM